MSIDHRLAVYGSLAPGRANHRQLSEIHGDWVLGRVKGRLVFKGWGTALGFPALVLDEDGDNIEVHLLISTDLPANWDRLDAFEGSEYRRAQTQVDTAVGIEQAWIYVEAGSVA